MQQVVTMSNEQASTFAAVIFPAIRGYIDQHREEYEHWLKTVWEPAHKEQAGGGSNP